MYTSEAVLNLTFLKPSVLWNSFEDAEISLYNNNNTYTVRTMRARDIPQRAEQLNSPVLRRECVIPVPSYGCYMRYSQPRG